MKRKTILYLLPFTLFNSSCFFIIGRVVSSFKLQLLTKLILCIKPFLIDPNVFKNSKIIQCSNVLLCFSLLLPVIYMEHEGQ